MIPLARFLPADPPGIVHCWLHRNASRTNLILDPFGASPLMALETAASGYTLLTACNNPVVAFELSMLASAPSRDELTTALVELASQKKGEERLEAAIKDLYQTTCASCGETIQASAYLWLKGEPFPHARIYTCPVCGDSGEHPITDEDVVKVQQLQRADRLHRSRALERVLDSGSEDRLAVEEALSVYSPRPLYVLFTLINKLEGMSLTARKRELLEALLLTIMDAANSIWSWPQERERPRQLSTPPQYIEKNLWMELETAVGIWSAFKNRVKVTLWPEMPEGAGICIHRGRMRDLAREPGAAKVSQIVTVFPRPNQAFWTLCGLWSSWLWGREQAGRFAAVMERKRFDWNWHTSALHAALSPAAALSGPGVRMFGVIPEPAPGLINAVVGAASVSRLNLTGFATMNAVEPVQMEWKTSSMNREFKPVNLQKIIREAIREMLSEIGEPTEYIELHTAAMCALADENAFPPSIQQLTPEKSSEIQSVIQTLLADRLFLRRMDATAKDPESGLWWLAQPENTQTPLADRVELEIQDLLISKREILYRELLQNIHQRFPGYLTPPDTLLRHCLESYAIFDQHKQVWTIKEKELPSSREKNVQEMLDLVDAIARKLGLRSEGDHPIIWSLGTRSNTPLYHLVVGRTAAIDRDLLTNLPEGCEIVFVLPGSRSGLLKFKIERDPFLAEQIAKHCHFLKYRTLRSIAARSDLSLELWKVLIESDPISLEETTQLSMFG